jgi:proteasome beta subunit
LPGATTVGMVCKDGVVLASERRVSYGYFVMSKTGKKVFKITDKVGAACAGIVADMQILTREVSAYLNIYSYERELSVTVRTAAKLMGSMLFERRYFPYITQTIVGGIDESGSKLFVLDPLGSVIEDKYTAVGSGSEIAMGLLQRHQGRTRTHQQIASTRSPSNFNQTSQLARSERYALQN